MELDFWRRSCGVRRLDKIRNEEITARAEVDIIILESIDAKT